MSSRPARRVNGFSPNASIVYDLFDVIAKYGREVIDSVRVDEANSLKDDKPARKWVKRARWVLLQNRLGSCITQALLNAL